MNDQSKHIPFHSIDELNFHIEMSNTLASKIKDRVNQFNHVTPEAREVLENYVTDSLNVLVDCYVNMILSIQQGYIK